MRPGMSYRPGPCMQEQWTEEMSRGFTSTREEPRSTEKIAAFVLAI
jgi:hypothetical protein